MMTVPMDNSLAPSSRELAERLYKKNIELETALRKNAKARVPSDPNTWFQICENYESIILEDHDFSQKHEVEFALWQLHYRRIEEFRKLFNAAKSAGSVTSQGGRTPSRPDSLKKIHSGFQTFLSESTGFYHGLILKIRAKFGLPLGFFSDSPESQTIPTKNENKSSVTNKGQISCHRSLIYLGDLARYKGSYGEGDAISREYAAASSYYKQAASLYPSSGNPHHQLAILASYSGDEMVSIYRYFRSLAADIPFLTARENLIIAFEKNRQSFSEQPANPKAVVAKTSAARTSGRGRGKGDARLLAKDSKLVATPAKEGGVSIPEVLKAFSTRFVRVNGILFTRTSLETFEEVFSSVKSDFLQLLSTGPREELNFGQNDADNGLFIVRLIAILIFTVYNVNKESDGESYAKILQRTVLLQNAFTAAFEFAGDIIKRCLQLHDAASSFLLPAILVFIEWLACHPDIAAGSDVDEKQAGARSFFWNQCVALMNKLISSGLVSGGKDEDEACFSDMSRYDGETDNRLALWEDFELRGFLPLVPAQIILEFSRRGDGSKKERQARAQRILAAGRALMNVVHVSQQTMYFDPRLKKFSIGIEPPAFDDCTDLSGAPKVNFIKETSPVKKSANHGITQPKAQPYAGGEDDEEEIVFKPIAGNTCPSMSAPASMLTAHEAIQPPQISPYGQFANDVTHPSAPLNNFQVSNGLQTSSPPEPLHHVNLNTSRWLMEQAASLSKGLKNSNINGNGTEGLSSPSMAFAFSPLISSSQIDPISRMSCQSKTAEALMPSTLNLTKHPGLTSDGALPVSAKNTPVSRPVRHLGPPPGFSNVSAKQFSDSVMSEENPQADDYNWLDGYQFSSTKAFGIENPVNYVAHMHHHPIVDNASDLNGVMSFPFPGKQISAAQNEMVNEKKRQDYQLFDHLWQNSEQQPPVITRKHQAQSLWPSYFM